MIITVLKIMCGSGNESFQTVDCASSKQKAVRPSSCRAEIVDDSEAEDLGYCFKQAVRSINRNMRIAHLLYVDARGRIETIPTFCDGK